MNLEQIYYLLAILNNVFWLIFLGILIALVSKMYFTIKSAPEKIKSTLSEVISKNKKEFVMMAGMTAFTILGSAFQKWTSRNR